MARILFLAHRIPYPPNKGDKIRSWHFFKHLAENHEVHVSFFIDDPLDLQFVDHIDGMCASVTWAFASPLKQKIASLRGLLNGKSLTEMAYPSKSFRKSVSQKLVDGIDLIFLYSAATATFLPNTIQQPIITDLVDVDSAKWEAYAHSAKFPVNMIYAREGRCLGAFEAALAKRSEASILVSGDEAKLFESRLSRMGMQTAVCGIENGVNIDVFDPAKYSTEKQPREPVLLFTGAMDYAPNIEAVIWFADHVFPSLRQEFPDLLFRIAGRPVASQVQALDQIDGIEVVGPVDDMAQEIAAASVIVAPLQTARGIQNKVLEGMAMAKPVVCTSAANEGINAPSGKCVLQADLPVDFARAVKDLLLSPATRKEIGRNARTFVTENFSWMSAFEKLDNLIDGVLKSKESS